MSLSLTSSAVLASRFMYSSTESSRSAEHGPMMSTLRASSPVKTLATSASNACFLAVSSAESGISSRISMGIGSLRLNSMAIRGLLYQLTATIGEFSNARHYPLSHAKVQALVTPKPTKKGQVYFGSFYLGKRWRALEWNDATWLGRDRRSSSRGRRFEGRRTKTGVQFILRPRFWVLRLFAAGFTPPRRTASCTGRRRSRPGRVTRRACPSRRYLRRGLPGSRRRCGSWTGGAR